MDGGGGMSKAAKKNQKKRAAKKKTTSQTSSSSSATGSAKHLGPADILPLLKEEHQLAKQNKDHARVRILTDQMWVLNDLVAGVRTDIPDEEYEEILQQLPIPAQDQKETTEEPSSGASSLTSGERRLRALKKKLDQIDKLKEREERGETIEENQRKKMDSEQDLRNEISELEELLRTIL